MANMADGWELANMQARDLPQKVASGFGNVTPNMVK